MVATIVNYCSNDYRFLESCLREARKFSKEIIVPVCDHFFDGGVENRLLLEHSYANHPDVRFIEFAFGKEPYGLYASVKEGDPDWIHYWHSTARYVGYDFVSREIEKVLFLDVDEVAEGDKMKYWLETFPHHEFDAVRFTNYFYFREAKFQATKIMRNGLLVKKESLPAELLLDVEERKGTFYNIQGERLEGAPALDGEPLFHHYSWVKTKGEMLRKVSSWGHHLEKDWPALIEEEFSKPFQNKDSFWGFDYREVVPFVNPLSVTLPTQPIQNSFFNVTKIDRRELQRMQIRSAMLN